MSSYPSPWSPQAHLDYVNSFQHSSRQQFKEQTNHQLLFHIESLAPDLTILSASTLDGFETTDMWLKIGNQIIMAECKIRYSASTDKSSWACDESKFDKMVSIASQMNLERGNKPPIICALVNYFTEDGVFLVLKFPPKSQCNSFWVHVRQQDNAGAKMVWKRITCIKKWKNTLLQMRLSEIPEYLFASLADCKDKSK